MKGGLQNAFSYDTVFFVKITGKIVRGAGRGRALGFPTLNIEAGDLNLDFGVYAVWVELHGVRYKGAMSYGSRPTFDDSSVALEVFVLDYSGEDYGEVATVEVVRKIRDIKKFDSAEDLKKQIEQDVKEVREVLMVGGR